MKSIEMNNPNTFKYLGADLNPPLNEKQYQQMVSTIYHCNTIFLTVTVLFCGSIKCTKYNPFPVQVLIST
ncbi:MAG: hypothetical protein K9G36_06590 [Crocinitomicaceae bacterium]|nr:hypothetical protein [Crocinitomicaceae bacterium]MCF8411406.1 hypothetical protein [Crocinitomicaceae bacterium]